MAQLQAVEEVPQNELNDAPDAGAEITRLQAEVARLNQEVRTLHRTMAPKSAIREAVAYGKNNYGMCDQIDRIVERYNLLNTRMVRRWVTLGPYRIELEISEEIVEDYPEDLLNYVKSKLQIRPHGGGLDIRSRDTNDVRVTSYTLNLDGVDITDISEPSANDPNTGLPQLQYAIPPGYGARIGARGSVYHLISVRQIDPNGYANGAALCGNTPSTYWSLRNNRAHPTHRGYPVCERCISHLTP